MGRGRGPLGVSPAQPGCWGDPQALQAAAAAPVGRPSSGGGAASPPCRQMVELEATSLLRVVDIILVGAVYAPTGGAICRPVAIGLPHITVGQGLPGLHFSFG